MKSIICQHSLGKPLWTCTACQHAGNHRWYQKCSACGTLQASPEPVTSSSSLLLSEPPESSPHDPDTEEITAHAHRTTDRDTPNHSGTDDNDNKPVAKETPADHHEVGARDDAAALQLQPLPDVGLFLEFTSDDDKDEISIIFGNNSQEDNQHDGEMSEPGNAAPPTAASTQNNKDDKAQEKHDTNGPADESSAAMWDDEEKKEEDKDSTAVVTAEPTTTIMPRIIGQETMTVPQVVGEMPSFVPLKSGDPDAPHNVRGPYDTEGRWITVQESIAQAGGNWLETKYFGGPTVVWNCQELWKALDPFPPPDPQHPVWLYEDGDMYLGPWTVNGGRALEHGSLGFYWNGSSPKWRGLINVGRFQDGQCHGPCCSWWLPESENWKAEVPHQSCPQLQGQLYIFQGFMVGNQATDEQGICTLRDGETREGLWKNDKPVNWDKHKVIPTPPGLAGLVPIKSLPDPSQAVTYLSKPSTPMTDKYQGRLPKLVGELPEFTNPSIMRFRGSPQEREWTGQRGINSNEGKWITLEESLVIAGDNWLDTNFVPGKGDEDAVIEMNCIELWKVSDPFPPPDIDHPVWLYDNGDMYLGPWNVGSKGLALEHGSPTFYYNNSPEAEVQGLVHTGSWEDGFIYGKGISWWLPSSKHWKAKVPNKKCPRLCGQLFIYQGDFVRDYKQGKQGICTLKNGETRQGEWLLGDPVGWIRHNHIATPANLKDLVPVKVPSPKKKRPQSICKPPPPFARQTPPQRISQRVAAREAAAATSKEAISKSDSSEESEVEEPTLRRSQRVQNKAATAISKRPTRSQKKISYKDDNSDDDDLGKLFFASAKRHRNQSNTSDEDKSVDVRRSSKLPRSSKTKLTKVKREKKGEKKRVVIDLVDTSSDDDDNDDDGKVVPPNQLDQKPPASTPARSTLSPAAASTVTPLQSIENWLLSIFPVSQSEMGRTQMREYAQRLESEFFTVDFIEETIVDGSLTATELSFMKPFHCEFLLRKVKAQRQKHTSHH